jgi:acetyltransferase
LQSNQLDNDLTTWRDLSPLMNPRSVAVVGASQRSDALPNREPRGNRVIRNLKNFGYPGRIVAINPKYREVMDCSLLSGSGDDSRTGRLRRLGGAQSLCTRFVRSRYRRRCSRCRGIRCLDSPRPGLRGKNRQARLETLSRERGFLICGPNCYGVLNVFGKAPLFASSIPPGFLAGPVALVSQSGGLSTTIANALMLNRHVGLSHIVSCGNQSGATFEEYFNYFVEDKNTQSLPPLSRDLNSPKNCSPSRAKPSSVISR